MNNVYGYCRESTSKQDIGLDAQREQIAAYYNLRFKDVGPLSFFTEPATSAMRKPIIRRPQGARLDRAADKGDVIIFTKVDRAFRSTRDFCNVMEVWNKRGIQVFFTGTDAIYGTANGNLLLTILGAVAQWEGNIISERTKDALAYLRSQGRRSSGKAPVGSYWKATGKFRTDARGQRRPICVLVPDERQRQLITWVVEQRMAGHTCHDIAMHMMDNKIFDREGKLWDEKRIWAYFQNWEQGKFEWLHELPRSDSPQTAAPSASNATASPSPTVAS